MNVSWLDVKLGMRMVAKYPWLSGVSVIGMAVAIAIGAAYFSIIGVILDSTLPVDDGDRVVAIETKTIAGPEAGHRDGVSPHDFVQWRSELKSITDLGAFIDERRNLTTTNARTELVRVAAITASGFRLMRTPPVLGRTLLDEDERIGAPPVVVIGYDQWRRQFHGDEGIIGTSVRLDATEHTIIGVMPEGFLFPFRHHYWVALRLTGAETTVDGARSLHVFGRLADGFSLTHARTELVAAGDRMAVAFPQSHASVRAQALPYTQSWTEIDGPQAQRALRSLQLGAGILLLIVAANVAILVYARTARRTGEIVVRTALGANRGRVVSQLFLEALVLTATAAALGLGIVAVAFRLLREWIEHAPHDRMPFWFQPALSLSAVLYVAALAVISGVVIGVLPALKATGRALQTGLQQFSARGSGMQLGGIWTALIVAQVAIAVAVLPAAIHNADEALRAGMQEPASAANQMLRGTLVIAGEGSSAEEMQSRTKELTLLVQRLEADPEVASVTFAQDFPGRERAATIDAESTGQILASSTGVATNLFAAFGVPVLAGRGFVAADASPGATAVVVDQTFADKLAQGANVVGRRIRYLNRGQDGSVAFGPWLEIVGVVPAFATSFTAPVPFASPVPRFYHAAGGHTNPPALVVRVRDGDARRFVPRLRTIAASVDPTLKIEDLASVKEVWNFELRALSIVASVILGVTASVLLLSAAGIYSIMSFTVTSRRREIGIRTALGADARRVLAGIFGRASAQLGAGIILGLIVAAALDAVSGGGMMGGRALILLPTVVAVMFTVGVLAAVGPALRGLAIQPTEALREE